MYGFIIGLMVKNSVSRYSMHVDRSLSPFLNLPSTHYQCPNPTAFLQIAVRSSVAVVPTQPVK